MRTRPKRKPVAGEATGFQKIEPFRGEFDGMDDTPACLAVQAFRLRQRYGLTWPVARLIASLHYERAAA